MKITSVPHCVKETVKDNWVEYLKDHQNPKTRVGHYVGTIIGVGGGVGAMIAGVPPEIAVPGGIIATYSCAIPSHPIFEGNKASTLKRLLEIKSIKDVPAKVGKVLFFMGSELFMSLLGMTGLLKRHIKWLGLNPSEWSGKPSQSPQVPQAEVKTPELNPSA